MKLKGVFVFALVVFCLFAFTVCGPKEEKAEEEELTAPKAQEEKKVEMTEQQKEMLTHIVFSEEAETYIKEEMKKEKPAWDKNPKEKLADYLIDLKSKLDGDATAAAEQLEECDAQIMIDEQKIENIKEVFKQKYSDRRFVFEIEKVSVEKVPEDEKRYLGEEKEENRIDMIAHCEFTFRLVETPGTKNQSGGGSMECPHRRDCHWSCGF